MSDIYHPEFKNVELRQYLLDLERNVPDEILKLRREKLEIDYRIEQLQANLNRVRNIVQWEDFHTPAGMQSGESYDTSK